MIKEYDTFTLKNKEYEVRTIVCDVVVALDKSSEFLNLEIFTVPELIKVGAFN